MFAGVGDGRKAILVLGFESADHGLQAWMARALELVSDHGGTYDAEAVARSMSDQDTTEHRSGAAGAWRFTEFARLDNVFDRNYVGSVVVGDANGRYYEPAPGRNWMAGVNARYTW